MLKADSMAEKVEWINKLRNVIGIKGGPVKGESGLSMRQSLSDGSLVSKTYITPDFVPSLHLRSMSSYFLFLLPCLRMWLLIFHGKCP